LRGVGRVDEGAAGALELLVEVIAAAGQQQRARARSRRPGEGAGAVASAGERVFAGLKGSTRCVGGSARDAGPWPGSSVRRGVTIAASGCWLGRRARARRSACHPGAFPRGGGGGVPAAPGQRRADRSPAKPAPALWGCHPPRTSRACKPPGEPRGAGAVGVVHGIRTWSTSRLPYDVDSVQVADRTARRQQRSRRVAARDLALASHPTTPTAVESIG
jgi:hypothetical protein